MKHFSFYFSFLIIFIVVLYPFADCLATIDIPIPGGGTGGISAIKAEVNKKTSIFVQIAAIIVGVAGLGSIFRGAFHFATNNKKDGMSWIIGGVIGLIIGGLVLIIAGVAS